MKVKLTEYDCTGVEIQSMIVETRSITTTGNRVIATDVDGNKLIGHIGFVHDKTDNIMVDMEINVDGLMRFNR